MASVGDVETPQTQCRDRVDWLVQMVSRHSGRYGLSLWISAAACLALYARGDLRTAPVEFSMLECWLIGLGCVGAPVLVMRLLGKRLTAETCLVVAALMAGVAVMFTVLVATGQLQLKALVASYWLIIPEALAIQAVNAADALHRSDTAVERVRAEERAERELAVKAAYLSGIAASYSYSRARAQDIKDLISGPTEEIQVVSGALLAELDARYGRADDATGATILHLHADRHVPPQDRASGH